MNAPPRFSLTALRRTLARVLDPDRGTPAAAAIPVAAPMPAPEPQSQPLPQPEPCPRPWTRSSNA